MRPWVLSGVLSFLASAAFAQTTTAGTPPPAKKIFCSVDRTPPGPAETALNRKDYTTAEKLFRAALATDPHNNAAHEGLVRTLLAQDRVADATSDATAWNTAEPANSMAFVALAESQVRGGVPTIGFQTYRKALAADPCNARAYYGRSVIEDLAGLYRSGHDSIQQAYALHPTDDDIQTAWFSTRPRAERLALWADYAEHSEQISDDDRAHLKTRLEKEALYHPSDCRISPASPQSTTVPMVPVKDGPTRFLGWGLDVKFNGQRRRLQIDTGASGITISRAAAMFLGIKREDATQTGGIGDKSAVKTSIAHVASIRIGDVELTNCPVEILEKWSVLETDGLIGADVFRHSVVALDFPKQQLRLSPLPARPDDPKPGAAPADDDSEPLPHNAYVAPEMATWTHIYRSGHELLVPGNIVQTKRFKDVSAWKDAMFLLDTGAATNLISPAAARAVTKVSRDSSMEIRGIQGQVDKVYQAGEFTLAFTNLRLDSPSMTAIDTTNISHGAGVEISGLVGAPALFQIVLHIDYRDNLIWCEYHHQ